MRSRPMTNHGFKGGHTTVKNYVREHVRRSREMFVPLAHASGHAQADFGEAMVVIGGVEQKAHFFALDLPHSDACFVRAYPAAVSEAWVDGHGRRWSLYVTGQHSWAEKDHAALLMIGKRSWASKLAHGAHAHVPPHQARII